MIQEPRRGKRGLTSDSCTNAYVMKILKLAFLAPDIIEAILAGRQPVDLSQERLRRTFSLDWSEQRQRLGFPPASDAPGNT